MNFLLLVAFPKAQISERLLENPAVRHFLLTFEEQDPFAVPDWNVASWGLDGIGFMFFAELCLSDGPRTLRLLGGLDLFEFQVLSECSQTLRRQMSFYHEDWPDLLPCIASIGIQARKCISDSWHTIMISHDITEIIFWLWYSQFFTSPGTATPNLQFYCAACVLWLPLATKLIVQALTMHYGRAAQLSLVSLRTLVWVQDWKVTAVTVLCFLCVYLCLFFSCSTKHVRCTVTMRQSGSSATGGSDSTNNNSQHHKISEEKCGVF